MPGIMTTIIDQVFIVIITGQRQDRMFDQEELPDPEVEDADSAPVHLPMTALG